MSGFAIFLTLTTIATGGPELALGGGKAAKVEERCRGPFPFEVSHPGLYTALDKAMRAAGLGEYLDEKALAVSVVDLAKNGKRYYAGFNDDLMMYAASLPKIAILLAVIEAVNDKEIEWTHEHDVRLQNMIRASSNPDASWATDLVGLLEIERVLRSKKYCLYDDWYGGLWVGRAYRRGGASNRDPLHDISHGATSRQAARFYTMLDAGRLVSKHWSFRMLGLMSPPMHFHKFVGGLNGTRGVIFLARKSGTWRTSHSDSALIQHLGNRYVAVGIADLENGESVMRDLIKVIDGVIMDGRHRRRARKRPSRQVRR